jgi:hypothetical protein
MAFFGKFHGIFEHPGTYPDTDEWGSGMVLTTTDFAEIIPRC